MTTMPTTFYRRTPAFDEQLTWIERRKTAPRIYSNYAADAMLERWEREAAILALYTDQLHYVDQRWQKLARDDRQEQRRLSVNDHHGWSNLPLFTGKYRQFPTLQYPPADVWDREKECFVSRDTKVTVGPKARELKRGPIAPGVIIAGLGGSLWSQRFDIPNCGDPIRAYEYHEVAGPLRFGAPDNPVKRWGQDEENPAPWPLPVASEQTPADATDKLGTAKFWRTIGHDDGGCRVSCTVNLAKLHIKAATPGKGKLSLPVYHLDPDYQRWPITPTPRNARVVNLDVPEINPRTGKPNTAERCRNDTGSYLDYPGTKIALKNAPKPITNAQRKAVTQNHDLLVAAEELRPRVYAFLLSKRANPDMAEEIAGRTIATFTEQVDKYKEQGTLHSWLFKIAVCALDSERRHVTQWDRDTKRAQVQMQQFSPLMDELGARAEGAAKDGEAMPYTITGASWAAVQDDPADPGMEDPTTNWYPVNWLTPKREGKWSGQAGEWTIHDMATALEDVTAEDRWLSPAQRKRKKASIYNWERYIQDLRRNISPEQVDWVIDDLTELPEVKRHALKQKLDHLRRNAGYDVKVKSKSQYDREQKALKRKARPVSDLPERQPISLVEASIMENGEDQ